MYHVNDEVEILQKLGILANNLRSPYRMISSVLDVPKPSSSANSPVAKDDWKWDDDVDESEDDIVFDQNSLLDRNGTNTQIQRTSSLARHASAITPQEALRWKLLCLCSAFIVMGLSTSIFGLTLPEISKNTSRSKLMEFAQISVASGFGFLVGSVSLCILFTRLNAFLFLLVLLVASVPCTTLIIWVTSFNWVLLLSFGQGVMFGAIERGGFLMVHGLWNGNKRVFFALYFSISLGASLSAMLSTPVVYDRIHSHLNNYTRLKRAEPSGPLSLSRVEPTLPNMNFTTGFDETTVPQKAARPQAAIGNNVDPNTKTAENVEERRKAEEKKKQKELEKAINEAQESSPIPAVSGDINEVKENIPIKAADTTPTTTTPSTTTTTAYVPTTTPTTPKPINPLIKQEPNNKFMPSEGNTASLPTLPSRARNRQSSEEKNEPKSTVTSMVRNSLNNVRDGLKEVNTSARLAYMIIMGLSFVLMSPFIIGFCCCCIKLTMIADSRIAQLRMDANKAIPESFKIRALSATVLSIASAADAILLAFLPKFIMDHNQTDNNMEQNSPALFTTAFWIATSFARAIFILRPSLSISSKVIHIVYILSIIFCYVFHHFLEKSEQILFFGIVTVAIFSANIPQAIIVWHHTLLDPSVYRLSRRYLASLSIGRMLGPILCAYWCDRTTTMVLFKLILVIHIVGYVFFIFLSRAVHSESRQRHIQQLGGEVSGQTTDSSKNGKTQKRKGPYRALLEEDDDDVDLEMDYIRRPSMSDSADEM